MTHKADEKNSIFDGFSKRSYASRRSLLKTFAKLSDQDLDILSGNEHSLKTPQAEMLIENVIGMMSLPIGLATHFLIDEKEVVVPMVVEETSIIAAASSAAKWVKRNGGFKTEILGRSIIGQIQFPKLKNLKNFISVINENSEKLIQKANQEFPNLVARGGGVLGIHVRKIKRPDFGTMAVLHIVCDPCDAMGANIINQICETLKKPLEKLTGEKIGMCILSNLADTKRVQATCEISDISPELGRAIEEAVLFANCDPYRCATHNKGVMNGIDPVLIATGNDWRAVEAGIHTDMAVQSHGSIKSITDWKYRDGKLFGKFVAPMMLGTVGGVTQIHPTAKVALKILGIQNSHELARICAATGLAQNLAALKALCSEGIVKGHMRLHTANLAMTAGATSDEMAKIQKLLKEEHISYRKIKELLIQVRKS